MKALNWTVLCLFWCLNNQTRRNNSTGKHTQQKVSLEITRPMFKQVIFEILIPDVAGKLSSYIQISVSGESTIIIHQKKTGR